MRLGGLGVASLGTILWRGRAAATWLGATPVQAAGAATFARAASCVLTPEQTEGPYYIAKEKVRRNIVEHKHGTPLALRLAVVDAATCLPISGAAVDIWHCDAAGIYVGFGSASTGSNSGPPPGGQGGPPPGGQGGPPPGGNSGPPPGGQGGPGGAGAGPTDKRTFLRSIQVTDARGQVAFDTIYPGWYRGRTVHIHVKVHASGKVVHTGQLFFADSLTD